MRTQPCIAGWGTKAMVAGAEVLLVAESLGDLEMLFQRVVVGGVFKKEICHRVAVVSLSRLEQEGQA